MRRWLNPDSVESSYDQMENPCRLIGVLLAAGRGGRMGGRKQLVTWRTPSGDTPLIAAAYDAIRPICREIVVVLGAAADLVAAALGDRQFHRTMSDPACPMFDSIRAGLLVARSLDANATIVLHPADHPEVAAATLHTLATWSLKRPGQVIIPEHKSHGGHPVLVPAEVAARLLTEDCPEGLGRFWREHPELCVRVAVGDPSVIRDIDTPNDLLR